MMRRAPVHTTQSDPRKICFVVSAAITAEAFLAGHIAALAQHYEVHLAANAAPESLRHPAFQGVTCHFIAIERAIAPWADARAVARLVAILRRERYAAVHSLTPKAGLVAALAAFFARVPVRMHTYTGQVWATRKGALRGLLKALDRLIARLDTHVLVDSASQRDFLRAEGVLGARQGTVLGNGSVAGVDAHRFRPDAAARRSVRERLGIPSSARVFLYTGRLARDKGVLDLARAFSHLAAARDDVYLVLVGPDEASLAGEVLAASGAYAARVLLTGHSSEPERHMAAADVFCLPSYREGFGAVIVEAAAAGLPAIGSRIYGITDAIVEGETGVLYPPRDVAALAAAMRELAQDDALRERLGAAARERALREFSSADSSAALVEFYGRALSSTSPARGPAA